MAEGKEFKHYTFDKGSRHLITTRIGRDSTVRDIVVVIKVQTPALVGGPKDHALWDQEEYDKSKNTKFLSSLEYKNMLKNIN